MLNVSLNIINKKTALIFCIGCNSLFQVCILVFGMILLDTVE
ncbi:putative membrane protein [Ehrlichia chaffeensis str. Heartland]|uniref:Uncharacterized protein n=1 Tax=Ehrlichia chaffeensis (strain ATCC CRL-10679 / Arkansas) TaxID=205920 RepID=Q2GFW9_EHRCR|nr:hypothetical protein ECH_0869 [Ehrlichia chaffeensis str. Arkansas]AHX03913.1 putative membrane protein [Ehrlichia chaffeensis str. Heartland]AHX05358.1 putative membrane protein [Ehrlichia chaffeensis str. Jax]AHX06345.1 putative membrane protein [Ehrlichia chaffeensis str. Liberty]AHX07760.1 putative membrane protein [Ehrlichia chaffeensis str. Osceola]AHX08613.1 putative membrane protein [Ehrlichia chaffeensis str. Saint Vincent]AHX09506.1 putative membrane protein [Ehrlichia chaffeensi